MGGGGGGGRRGRFVCVCGLSVCLCVLCEYVCARVLFCTV